MGTASHNINDCKPNCAGGTFFSYPVKVALSHPATVGGALVFTVITMIPSTRSGSQESATDAVCQEDASGTCPSSGPDWGFVTNSP